MKTQVYRDNAVGDLKTLHKYMKIYKSLIKDEEVKVTYAGKYEGMRLRAEVYEPRKNVLKIAWLIRDDENNENKYSIYKNSRITRTFGFMELKQVSRKKEKKIKIDFNFEKSYELYGIKEKECLLNLESNVKEIAGMVLAYEILRIDELCGELEVKNSMFDWLAGKIYWELEDALIVKKREQEEKEKRVQLKEEAVKELQKITNVYLNTDGLLSLVMGELSWNIFSFEDNLRRLYPDYTDNMSIQSFLLQKFGQKTVDLAKTAFNINDFNNYIL